MPIYAYKCDSCGHAKDVLQKMSDAVLTDCPACGASTFKKQLTAAGFQLKGSGWYVTDFKGGAAATGVASGDKTGAAAEPTAGGKADSSAPAGSGGGEAASKADSKVETKSAPSAEVKAATPVSATPAASSQ
jgi:putative FmdB family regulatory protein